MRSSVDIALDETSDLARAREVALETMRAVPGVLDDPAPQALLTEVCAATVTLELRFWSGARQFETLEAKDAVILAVLRAFADTGVRTGSEAVVLEPGPMARDALAHLSESIGDGRLDATGPVNDRKDPTP